LIVLVSAFDETEPPRKTRVFNMVVHANEKLVM
jgi:hypothetical protein